MIKIGSVVSGLMLFLISLFPAKKSDAYRLLRVVDGDTMVVAGLGQTATVRLLGIDAAELSAKNTKDTCWAFKAKDRLNDLVDTSNLFLKSDPTQENKDKYGRWLRYVEVGQTDVAEVLLTEGLAETYPYFKVSRGEHYQQVVNEAMLEKQGKWGGECVK